MKIKLKIEIVDQDLAVHAVVCKYRDMVMNQLSTVFYSSKHFQAYFKFYEYLIFQFFTSFNLFLSCLRGAVKGKLIGNFSFLLYLYFLPFLYFFYNFFLKFLFYLNFLPVFFSFLKFWRWNFCTFPIWSHFCIFFICLHFKFKLFRFLEFLTNFWSIGGKLAAYYCVGGGKLVAYSCQKFY